MPATTMKNYSTKKTYKILMAEDDEDDFYIFNLAVSAISASFNVLRTTDGIMFSSLVQTAITPDVIFLDINMPYKSGIACLKEIRSNASYRSSKVVMYSTSSCVRDIERCYELGADFYLVKPSSFSGVTSQLNKLFDNEYFRGNEQTPRHQFVITSSAAQGDMFAIRTLQNVYA